MTILARPGFLPPLTEPARALGVADVSSASTDKARLTELYATYGGKIHRFLSDLLGDAALAADATQETFVRAYKRLADMDEAGRPMPWLFGIARNVSLELRKARQRAGKHLLLVNGSALEDTPSRSSPESEYLDREALRVVGTAMARLPEERRAMLLLRLDHGLSYEDIALTMGCSLAKAKVEIFRAREVLRSTMAEYEQS